MPSLFNKVLHIFFNGEISVLLNIAFSIPLTIILAVLSWHLIEKPVLKLKKIGVYFKSGKYGLI